MKIEIKQNLEKYKISAKSLAKRNLKIELEHVKRKWGDCTIL